MSAELAATATTMEGNSSLTLPDITDAEIWVVNTIFYMIGGSLAVITNFIVFLVITRDKNLRASSFFVEVSIMSINRCSVSLQLVIISVYRLLKLLDLAPEVLSRLSCYLLFFALIHFATTDMAFLCIMAIDRLIAIARPFVYKAVTVKLVTLIMAVVFALAVMGNHLPALFDDMPGEVLCINIKSPLAPNVYYGIALTMLMLSFLIVMLYAGLIFYILVTNSTWYHGVATGHSLLDATARKQLELLPPLLILVVSGVICVIIPKTLLLFASFSQNSTTSARLVAFAGIMSNIDFNVMCWALLARSSDFRAAFRKQFMRKRRAVSDEKNDTNVMHTIGLKPVDEAEF